MIHNFKVRSNQVKKHYSAFKSLFVVCIYLFATEHFILNVLIRKNQEQNIWHFDWMAVFSFQLHHLMSIARRLFECCYLFRVEYSNMHFCFVDNHYIEFSLSDNILHSLFIIFVFQLRMQKEIRLTFKSINWA